MAGFYSRIHAATSILRAASLKDDPVLRRRQFEKCRMRSTCLLISKCSSSDSLDDLRRSISSSTLRLRRSSSLSSARTNARKIRPSSEFKTSIPSDLAAINSKSSSGDKVPRTTWSKTLRSTRRSTMRSATCSGSRWFLLSVCSRTSFKRVMHRSWARRLKLKIRASANIMFTKFSRSDWVSLLPVRSWKTSSNPALEIDLSRKLTVAGDARPNSKSINLRRYSVAFMRSP